MTIPTHILDVYQKSTLVFSVDQINEALDRMAVAIHDKLSESNPIVMCVMVGGLIPLGNLLTRIDFPLEMDYVHATRYRGETSGGELFWKMKPQSDLTNRTVLVVDDILDGGITLQGIVDYCREQGAKEVFTAVLVDKHEKRVEGGLANADFVGLQVADHYIFGFGMDYHEYLRNAPGIFMVAPEHE